MGSRTKHLVTKGSAWGLAPYTAGGSLVGTYQDRKDKKRREEKLKERAEVFSEAQRREQYKKDKLEDIERRNRERRRGLAGLMDETEEGTE